MTSRVITTITSTTTQRRLCGYNLIAIWQVTMKGVPELQRVDSCRPVDSHLAAPIELLLKPDRAHALSSPSEAARCAGPASPNNGDLTTSKALRNTLGALPSKERGDLCALSDMARNLFQIVRKNFVLYINSCNPTTEGHTSNTRQTASWRVPNSPQKDLAPTLFGLITRGAGHTTGPETRESGAAVVSKVVPRNNPTTCSHEANSQ